MFSEKLASVKEKYALVNKLVEAINDKELIRLSKFLKARLECPDSYVVMLGETSSGKSTLLNGLLGENILYTNVMPSTGAVVEIVFEKTVSGKTFFAINKDATMEELKQEAFIALSKTPDENLFRLRLKTSSALHGLGELRFFDTPGYGSLIEKHEEVLTEFLPQSDIVIYTVLYKEGIKEDDFNFLNYASELIGSAVQNKGTEFVLVINRVPEGASLNDSRVKEITGYVCDILHYTPEIFLVPNCSAEGDEYPLPQCPALWEYIQNSAASEKNQKNLLSSYTGYVFGLLEKCEIIIEGKALALKATKEEREFLRQKIKDLKRTRDEIVSDLIEPTFTGMEANLLSRFMYAKDKVRDAVMRKIDGAGKMSETEVMAFVNSHLLPFETKKQVDEIKFYLDSRLDELDRQVDGKLNTAYADMQKEIELHFSNAAAANMAKGLFKKIGGNVLERSLLNYFSQFAGRGGTGIANGAKHLLKKVGNLFGKTFSRETHNALAKFLSRIGATSAKAVGMAVTVIVDSIVIVYEILTWQGKLKKAVDKGLDKWYDESVNLAIKDLRELKTENIKLLDESIGEFIDGMDIGEADVSVSDVEGLEALLLGVKAKVGEYDGW